MPKTQVMAYPCSRALVQTTLVQTAKVQTTKVQTAKVQTQRQTLNVQTQNINKGSNEDDQTQMNISSRHSVSGANR
jgi:hypothetical protein